MNQETYQIHVVEWVYKLSETGNIQERYKYLKIVLK